MRRIETHFASLVSAGVDNVVGALEFRAAERPDHPACILLERGEHALAPLTYAALWSAARRVAAVLCVRAAPGARVLLAFPAGGDFVIALFACFLAGRIAVPCPPPTRRLGGQRLAAIAADCDARLLLTTRSVVADLPAMASLTALAIEDADAAEIEVVWPAPSAVALLQYTSGSTGAPRGVVITHRAIWHNQSVIRTCFDHAEGVVLVGWLPNFHDMGLIGNLLQPIYAGGVSVIMSPTSFTQKPMRWLQAVSRYQAHTSGAPNFAYDLCVRAATDAQCADLDLSGWRVAFNGAEPVRARTLDAFAARFAPFGFRREALTPCYGLAESTLMVAGERTGAAPVVLRTSRAKLAAGIFAPGDDGTDAVSCGDVVAGMSIRIADPASGDPAPDGAVGEVLVAGDSTCLGYWNNLDATRAAFRMQDGVRYLRTGDLGARHDGRLYIVGRAKEVLIQNGRTVHPVDIEEAILAGLANAGVVRVAVAAIAGAMSDEAVLFAEMTRDALHGPRRDALCAAMRLCAMRAAGTPLAAIVLVNPGGLPLTSSGKVRRAACRDLFFSGALSGVAHLDPGATRIAAHARPSIAGEITLP